MSIENKMFVEESIANRATSNAFVQEGDLALVGCQLVSHKIVHRQLDGLLRTDADQLRQEATVQAKDTFVSNDLLGAVPAVSVHQFTDNGATTLILHTGFNLKVICKVNSFKN